MSTVKDIVLKPITSQLARQKTVEWHYSHKFVTNSQLHFGAFLNGVLCGVMSFGPPMDKSKVIGLVKDTRWDGMLELNRMAFSDALPKNSESRCIAIACKLIKKHYPQIKWILSFADGTQCGDGTIYRASGFLLTQVKQNTTIMIGPQGEVITKIVLTRPGLKITRTLAKKYGINGYDASNKQWEEKGFRRMPGYQLRYIKILDPAYRDKLTCPVLPYSAIEEAGAGMYKGERR